MATAVLAAKEATRAGERIFWAQDEKGAPLTVKETVLTAAPCYIPAVMVGAGTIACIFGANALNQKQQAMLMSAYAALESSYQEYRNKVDAYCGEGTSEFVERAMEQEKQDQLDDDPPWDRVQTFYIEGVDGFFERTMDQVMWAEYHLNRNFIIRGSSTLNEFLEFLGLDPVENGGLGWDEYIGETQFGYKWIDFDHRHYTTDDGLQVCAIDMPFAPHSLFEEEYDWRENHLLMAGENCNQEVNYIPRKYQPL